jgi:prepilin-type N-terminal cleavage/methylation domain-containing protein
MNESRCGFTLMELILVIVILGILAAVAMPRFLNLSDDALAASRAGIAGSLNSAIQIVHSRWLAQGGGATVSLDGAPITMNAAGYPDVGAGLTYGTAASCATLVGGLLGGPPPSDAADCTGVTVPLRVGFSGSACQVNSCPTSFATSVALSPTSAQ